MSRKNTKLKAAIQLVSSNALAQVLPIIFLPVFTRLYSEEQFGELGFFNTLVLVFGVIGSFRYDQLLYTYDSEKVEQFFSIGLQLSLAFLVLFCIGVVPFLVGFNNIQEIILISFCIFLFSIVQLLIPVATVHAKFKLISISFVIKACVTVLAQLVFAFFEYTKPIGLVFGFTIGLLAQSAVLLFYCKTYASLSISFDALLSNIKAERKFLGKSTLQSGLNSLSSNLPPFYIAAFFNMKILGLYTLALKLVFLPITFLGNAIRPLVIKHIQQNIESERLIGNYLFLKKCFSIGIVLVIIPMPVVYYLGPSFFVFYAGEGWSDAGVYAAILSPWIFVAFINIPSVSFLTVTKRIDIQLKYDFYLLIFRVFVLIYAYISSLGIIQFLIAYATVGLISNLILIIHTLKISKEEYETQNVLSN